MGTQLFNRHTTWTVFFSLLITLGLGACSDVSNAPAPTPLPPGTPVANAGPDLGSIAFGTSITLNGSASVDPNGDPLTYKWTLVSKPVGSAAVLQNPNTVAPTFVVDRDGDYIVQLIVNDGKLDSAPDTAIISSNNVAPVANAGPDQGGKLPGSLITLNGSASSDSNGDPLTFSWTFLAKPAGSAATLANPTSVSPTFTIDRDGDYIVQLVVNDGTVNSNSDSVLITSDNVAPVANAGLDQGGKVNGSLVTLNGSASSDANGDPLTYSWSLTKPAGSAAVLANPTSVSPTFTVDRDGTYTAQLIVNDGTVSSAPDTVNITSDNVAPVANAGPDQGGKVNGSLVTLNGSGSSDANGDPLTYSWSLTKPAGSNATLVNPTSVSPTFTVDLDGTYTAQLIVNDGTVSSAPDTVNIISVNVSPVANAGPDQGGKTLGSLITLDGSGSIDANGDPLTYSWSLTTKPLGSAAVLTNPTSVSPTFTIDYDGIYTAQLIVNDGTVSSTPDTVNITSTSTNVPPVANAGPDQGGKTLGLLITLDGSGSIDANGDPLTYSWSLTTKPLDSAAVLANPTSVSPTFTGDLAGDYVAQLIVNDGTVDSDPDSVIVTMTNTLTITAPSGPTLKTAKEGQNYNTTLSGTGGISPYNWSITPELPTGLALNASTGAITGKPAPGTAGDYTLTITLTDTFSTTKTKVVTLTVNPA